MNTEGEISRNDNLDPKNVSSYEHLSELKEASNFNCFHVLISFIFNFGLIIISVIEFVFKSDCLIFNYLVDVLIIFVFIFVIAFLFTKNENYLKGFAYYPICSLFWGTADLLSIFYIENSHDWNKSDNLKIAKISLIALSLLINICYMTIFQKNNIINNA